MHTRTILVAILCTGGFLAELDAQATRYRDLVFSGELEDWLHGNLAARAERIEDAAIRDLAAWGREHEFDGELEYLEASIDVRFDTLRSALD